MKGNEKEVERARTLVRWRKSVREGESAQHISPHMIYSPL